MDTFLQNELVKCVAQQKRKGRKRCKLCPAECDILRFRILWTVFLCLTRSFCVVALSCVMSSGG